MNMLDDVTKTHKCFRQCGGIKWKQADQDIISASLLGHTTVVAQWVGEESNFWEPTDLVG